MKKRVLSLFLAVMMLLVCVPLGAVPVAAGSYDASAAVNYAAAHWNDGVGACATFVSNCLSAGGCSASNSGVANLRNALINGGWGTLYQLTKSGSAIYESQNAGKLSAGDPIFYWCNACGGWMHVVICGGFNSAGKATAYGHNAAWNNVTYVGGFEDENGHTGSNIVAYSFHMNSGPHTHNYNTFAYYWASHPHYRCYRCSCGEVKENTSETRFVDSCELCTSAYAFSSIDAGTYYIRHNASDLYMNVAYSADEQEQSIHLYKWLSTATGEQYEITYSSDIGGYALRPLCSSSRVVNAYATTVVDGKKVCLYDNVYDATQRWNFEKVSGGYIIRNAQNPSCVLDIDDNGYLYVKTYTGVESQIWSLDITISYDNNGGTGGPGIVQTAAYGAATKLNSTIPTRDGYNFLGWSTSSTATTATYSAGGSFTANKNTTLYAVWEKAHTHTWTAATCTAPKTCSSCGETEGTFGHTYGNSNICSVCGEMDATNFTYTVTDGSATITGYTGTAAKLTIPDALGGYPVVAIGDGAFNGCTALTSVTIPDSVCYIGASAFLNTGIYNNSANWTGDVLYIGDYLVDSAIATSGSLVIREGTRVIAKQAFYNRASLTAVTIPASVAYVGSEAFYGCTAIDAVYITDLAAWCGVEFGVYQSNPLYYGAALYVNNTLVENLTIPAGVSTVRKYIFNGCSSITEVIIPEGVTTIQYGVFYGCPNLSSVEFPATLTTLDGFTFYGCTSLQSLSIPGSLSFVGNRAFYGCTSLESVAIAEGVTGIGNYTFYRCEALTEIGIPASVTSIGNSTFYGCSSLTDVYYGGTEEQWSAITAGTNNDCLFHATIHYGTLLHRYEAVVTAPTCTQDGYTTYTCAICGDRYVGDRIAAAGHNWTPATLLAPKACTVCGETEGNALLRYTLFNGQATITGLDSSVGGNLILPSVIEGCTVTAIGEKAFNDCVNLTSVVIPDSVTSIGSSAFRGCFQLTSVELGKNVTSIGAYAFYYCSRLTSVYIPGSVTVIAEKAFSDCSRLTSVTMEEGVATIDIYAFYNCVALTTVTLPKSVTSIGAFAFTGSAITDVYFGGTQKQWSAISIDSNNKPLTDATIHCSEVDNCEHTWTSATCTTPKTCSICGETEGEALGHTWTNATCTTPKTCTVCGETEGVAGGHNYVNGICTYCNKSYAEGFDKLVKTYNTSTASFSIYESDAGLYMLAISGNGAIPVWSGLSNYADSIHTIVIREGLTSIPYGAYAGMTALETVVLPSTLTTINGAAFQNCTNLTSINLEEGLTTIGYAAFLNTGLTEVTIPDSVTTMGTWVFANCKSLTSVTFGASNLAKKTLPARTFSGCSALKNVDFGSKLRIIDDYAFNKCGLESLSLPANIKSVDNAAFYKNQSLKSLKVEDSGATYLGWASFYGCSALKQIDLGDSLTSISTWVFTSCNSLKEITIPDTVNNIGRCTFKWCTGLETVKLSEGMTSIKDELFAGCTKLQNVTPPTGLTSIGAKSFYRCKALTELAYGESVTVADNAFLNSGIH